MHLLVLLLLQLQLIIEIMLLLLLLLLVHHEHLLFVRGRRLMVVLMVAQRVARMPVQRRRGGGEIGVAITTETGWLVAEYGRQRHGHRMVMEWVLLAWVGGQCGGGRDCWMKRLRVCW